MKIAPTEPQDGMTLAQYKTVRDVLRGALEKFERTPANCQHCAHFEMGDCKKHSAPIPKEFQTAAEACEDWTFDGIPFASSAFAHDLVTSKARRMRGYDY